MTMLPIKPGTARALGLRQPTPQPRPVRFLRTDHELTEAEREDLIQKWEDARYANPRPVFLVVSPDQRTVTPRRRDLPYIRDAIRRQRWPFGRTR